MDPQKKENEVYEDRINYGGVVVKRKKLIIGMFLFSVILTAVISLLMPKIYRGEAIFTITRSTNANISTTTTASTNTDISTTTTANANTTIITPKEIMDIIGNRKEMVFTKNLSSVESLKIAEVLGSNDKLRVTIDSRNAATIENSFTEIAEYIRNYPLIKNRLEMETEKIKKQIESISALSASYAEFAKNYDNLIREKRLSVISFNPAELKQKVYDLEIQKMILEKTLKNFTLIEMNPVFISKNPVKPKIKENILIAATTSLLISILLSFFMEYADRLKKSQ